MHMVACLDRRSSAHQSSQIAGTQRIPCCPHKRNTLQAAHEGGLHAAGLQEPPTALVVVCLGPAMQWLCRAKLRLSCVSVLCSHEVPSLQEYRVALLALGSAHTELQAAQRQAGITPSQQGEWVLPGCSQGWQSLVVTLRAATRLGDVLWQTCCGPPSLGTRAHEPLQALRALQPHICAPGTGCMVPHPDCCNC